MTENNAAHQNYLEAHRAVRDVLAANAVYFGGNTINAIVDAVLSKLRAEGVQAVEPKQTQEYTLRAMATNYSARHSWDHLDRDCVTAAADEIRALRAALASAPVAGEAPTDAEIIDMAVEPLGIDYDRMPYGIVKFARALLAQYAAPQASEAVRKPITTLAEFCAEADRIGMTGHTLAALLAERPEFADCLPQADKDGGDCAKGAGDE